MRILYKAEAWASANCGRSEWRTRRGSCCRQQTEEEAQDVIDKKGDGIVFEPRQDSFLDIASYRPRGPRGVAVLVVLRRALRSDVSDKIRLLISIHPSIHLYYLCARATTVVVLLSRALCVHVCVGVVRKCQVCWVRVCTFIFEAGCNNDAASSPAANNIPGTSYLYQPVHNNSDSHALFEGRVYGQYNM